MLRNWVSAFFTLSLFFVSTLSAAVNDTGSIGFSDDYERIFQIRVVSPDAGGKSSIGSGFQVTRDGLLITNYHVVSDYINSPDEYQIKYMTHNGELGDLQLVDFDVISDLAVLQHPNPGHEFFKISDTALDKGAMAYALGNPGDWGIIMVPGPTNGLVEHSYEDRVLFSGSLNAGMSGGPSLNSQGELIGVNVATAGSQLSFLVPTDKVSRLLARRRVLEVAEYKLEIARQIKDWQRPRIDGLLSAEWNTETFSGRDLFGEIRSDFQCWGGTNESSKERLIAWVSKSCKAGDEIYIGYDLDAGQIHFSFRNETPVKLGRSQFVRTIGMSMSADNSSDYKHSTNYRCEEDFIQGADSFGYKRIMSCVRAYKNLTGLYDSLLMVKEFSTDSVFEAHLSLSGMESDQILALNKRFVEAAK